MRDVIQPQKQNTVLFSFYLFSNLFFIFVIFWKGGVTVEEFCRILQLDKQSQGEMCLHVPVPETKEKSGNVMSQTFYLKIV